MAKESFLDRLKHSWSVFKESTGEPKDAVAGLHSMPFSYGGTSSRIDRARLHPSNERTITASLYNRIAIDVAAIPIKHVRVNENDQFEENIKSGLNDCLNVSANTDQTGRELIFDAVISMFDEGVVAIVPVDTSINLTMSNTFDINELRVGRITQWYPQKVKIEVYNERVGQKQEIYMDKSKVAIIQNPFYSVMNDRGSIVRRLIDKLALLDVIDQESGSTKLDMIVQLPYTIRTDKQKDRAEDRRKSIEDQLEGSKYGIAYIDATEHITQLNRSLDNNLMGQIEYLTSMLYSQLGVTKEVFDGTADERTMLNYYNATIEPVLSAITDEMNRKFLTKTARTQGQSIKFINNPFRLVPVQEMADIADKFTRNEILASNEVRSIVGYRPVDDPRANELRNKNLNASDAQLEDPMMIDGEGYEEYEEYEE